MARDDNTTLARKYFGTDGMRGRANTPPITADTVLRLGQAAGAWFKRGGHRCSVVIGKDTRLSGYMLEPALTAGFISVGMDVTLVGPMPTSAVAMLTRSLRADLGVMISASHNGFEDNGVKLFGPDGYKLSDKTELEIEAMMDRRDQSLLVPPHALGRAQRIDDAIGRYIESVKQTFPRSLTLNGLRVVVDCANGAAYKAAPAVLWELGAEVITVAAEPDGTNINRGCGPQAPDLLRSSVLKYRADLGIALDGDADRLALCDEQGSLVDGDQILGLVANVWKRKGRLANDAVAGTSMSNFGLETYLQSIGVTLERADVGDRYVVERMREKGSNLGGEQSGHIIIGPHATTGDGLVAAIQVMTEMVETKRGVSKLFPVFDPYPQLLESVAVMHREQAALLLRSNAVTATVAAWERNLNGSGRVVLRRSGTEPLIRVMVEAKSKATAHEAVGDICAAIKAEVSTAGAAKKPPAKASARSQA